MLPTICWAAEAFWLQLSALAPRSLPSKSESKDSKLPTFCEADFNVPIALLMFPRSPCAAAAWRLQVWVLLILKRPSRSLRQD